MAPASGASMVAKSMGLVGGMAQRVGMIGCHIQHAERRGEDGGEPGAIVDDAAPQCPLIGCWSQNGVATRRHRKAAPSGGERRKAMP